VGKPQCLQSWRKRKWNHCFFENVDIFVIYRFLTVFHRYTLCWFFSFIPKVEKLDISMNNLWQLTYDTFSENKNLTSLIMQGNLFNTLPMF
jgi:hypothetical protein